jgi:hypothetical protein
MTAQQPGAETDARVKTMAVFALGDHEWILAVEARNHTRSSVDQLIAGLP